MLLIPGEKSTVFKYMCDAVEKDYVKRGGSGTVEFDFRPVSATSILIIFQVVLSFVTHFFCVIFSKEQSIWLFKHRNIEFGKYVTSSVYRNTHANTSKVIFLKRYAKFLILGSLYLHSATKSANKGGVDAVFIGDVFYINGIIYEYFLQRDDLIAYMPLYPLNIVRCEGKWYDPIDVLKFGILQKSANTSKIDVENYMEERLRDPSKAIYYYDVKSPLITKKYYDNKKPNFVIYTHSFVDVQNNYGYDGFLNVYDWLKFTINFLSTLPVNIVVKLHPNIHRSAGQSGVEAMDLELWASLKSQLSPSVKLVTTTVSNYDFLKDFNVKDTVLISHHGNAAVEGAFLGFNTICSEKGLWFDEFKFLHTWCTKKEYGEVLEIFMTRSRIQFGINSNIKDEVIRFIRHLYLAPNNIFSSSAFHEVISRWTGISVKKIESSPDMDFKLDVSQTLAMVKEISEGINVYKK